MRQQKESFIPVPEENLEELQAKEGVVALMESSQSRLEWSANLDRVTKANKGLPDFWKEAVLDSGLMDRKLKSFPKLNE